MSQYTKEERHQIYKDALLSLIAVSLMYLLSPLFILYGLLKAKSFNESNDTYYKCAIIIDELGNILGASFFNDILIKSNGYQFGVENETISSVLGRNYLSNTLKPIGKFLRWFLDKTQKNHCVNSIKNEQ